MSNLMSSKGKLRTGFLNVNSMKAHIEQIRQFLFDNLSLDFFGVVETKLDERTMDSVIWINGYDLIRQGLSSKTEMPGKPRIPEIFSALSRMAILLRFSLQSFIGHPKLHLLLTSYSLRITT